MLTANFDIQRPDLSAALVYMRIGVLPIRLIRYSFWLTIPSARIIGFLAGAREWFHEVESAYRVYWLVRELLLALPYVVAAEVSFLMCFWLAGFWPQYRRLMGPAAMSVDENGVEEVSAAGRHLYPWPMVLKAGLTKSHLMIVLANMSVLPVRRTSENESSMQAIKEYIDDRTGARVVRGS